MAALFWAGCAENAVLELVIELPPAPADDGTGLPWFGVVQIDRATEAAFTTRRESGDRGAQPLELGAVPQSDCISAETGDESMDVEIRVRFCREPDCLNFLDDDSPERYYRLEHPFYIGRRTFWSTQIDRVLECSTDTDCGVGRCVGGVCGCSVDSDCCPSGGCQCPTDLDPVGGTCFACEDGPDMDDPSSPDRCVEVVDRCHIEGCTTGSPANFCSSRDERRHFCEEPTWADRVGTYPMSCSAD